LTPFVNGQAFLDAYKMYRLEEADTLSHLKTRKKIKRFIKSHLIELDTVFNSYKSINNFDFNTADTLFLIYYSPAESPFTSDIIIWSGKDTISYRQDFENIKPFTYKRIITYTPFIPKFDRPKGLIVVTERDSLVTLVSKRDYKTISRLGNNEIISDGSIVNIYVAFKENGRYIIESCSPQKFVIETSYIIE